MSRQMYYDEWKEREVPLTMSNLLDTINYLKERIQQQKEDFQLLNQRNHQVVTRLKERELMFEQFIFNQNKINEEIKEYIRGKNERIGSDS